MSDRHHQAEVLVAYPTAFCVSKALRLVKHLCLRGSPDFRRHMTKHSSVIRELTHYRCEVWGSSSRIFAENVLASRYLVNWLFIIRQVIRGPGTGRNN